MVISSWKKVGSHGTYCIYNQKHILVGLNDDMQSKCLHSLLKNDLLYTLSTNISRMCRNPSLGLATKVKACKGASQEGSLKVTSHAPGNVGECEGMNPHTPKWILTLRVGVPMDYRTFRERLQGSKPIGLRSLLYHWKALGTQMSKMGSDESFEHLTHKLWPRKGLKVKLTIWLLTTKSRKSPWFPFV
jgi:hypothetical protein